MKRRMEVVLQNCLDSLEKKSADGHGCDGVYRDLMTEQTLGSAEKEIELLLCLFLDLKELAMLKYIQEGSSEELNLYSELNPDCTLI